CEYISRDTIDNRFVVLVSAQRKRAFEKVHIEKTKQEHATVMAIETMAAIMESSQMKPKTKTKMKMENKNENEKNTTETEVETVLFLLLLIADTCAHMRDRLSVFILASVHGLKHPNKIIQKKLYYEKTTGYNEWNSFINSDKEPICVTKKHYSYRVSTVIGGSNNHLLFIIYYKFIDMFDLNTCKYVANVQQLGHYSDIVNNAKFSSDGKMIEGNKKNLKNILIMVTCACFSSNESIMFQDQSIAKYDFGM
ncbi:hypothetical protein RFI_32014, partial [Reticulomyxa filosa]